MLKLQQQVDKHGRVIEDLRQSVEELRRGGKRQASPFSKGKRSDKPKPPGRTPGQGPFSRRDAPDPGSYTQAEIEVVVTQSACSECGGELEADGEEVVTTTELPDAPKPEVRAYRVKMCRCRKCGKRVRGQHPDVASDQFGATAHRMGQRVMATAHWLHYGVGIPVRKLPGIFKELYGLSLTQSAITQDAIKRSNGSIATAYAQIGEDLRQSERVFADDTGWRINGVSAWLMGFSSDQERYYQIRRHHGNSEVREAIGDDYQGVLQTDRFRSYDSPNLSSVSQQKCLSHIQRNLSDLLQQQRGRAEAIPRRLKEILTEATGLWHEYRASPKRRPKHYRKRATALQEELTHVLRPRRLSNDANNRMVKELGWHNDRGSLLRFLDNPDVVEPTNNEAERALRPAVIARKVSQCSKTDSGAEAHAQFTSVIGTAIKRGAKSVVNALCRIFSSGAVPASFAE